MPCKHEVVSPSCILKGKLVFQNLLLIFFKILIPHNVSGIAGILRYKLLTFD